MKKYLSICFLLLLAYSAWLAQEALIILAYVVGSVAVIGLILFILIAVWYVGEKMLMMKADRIERQKQSETMLINTSDGTWVRETNPSYLLINCNTISYSQPSIMQQPRLPS